MTKNPARWAEEQTNNYIEFQCNWGEKEPTSIHKDGATMSLVVPGQ